MRVVQMDEQRAEAGEPLRADADTGPSTGTPPSRRDSRFLAALLLAPLVAALALWAFAWPAARTAPHDLPLGVAGPDAAVTQVEARLSAHKGAFELHRYSGEPAARAAIEDRDVYGAVVVTEQGTTLLTASAASPLVAQLLHQAVAQSGDVKTVDVVPAPATDPRGAALTASVLPLAMAGIAAGALVTLLNLTGRRAVASLLGSAALIGAVATGIADGWLGVLTGNRWAEAGALSLAALAVSAAVAGLSALIGRAGISIAAAVIMLLGNSFSAAASAPHMLPAPAGTLGQWLPPGAGATLLRSVSFFDGAATLTPALTLTWWAALGLGAVLLGSALKERKGREAASAH